MTKQKEPPYPPVTRRRSATAEDIAARRTTTEDYIPPASPHRVGHTPGLHGEDAPYMSGEIIRPGRPNGYSKTVPPMRNIPQQEEEDGYAYAESPRRAKTNVVWTKASPTRRLERTRFHWLLWVGLAMFIMIIGWLSFSALSSWWSVQQDDWHYGRPRTFQIDAVVGHEDSASHPSHFIAVNLNGQILVIEIPGGNAAKAVVYIGPRLFGAGQDLDPVTLSFEDCDGNGSPDLNIHIQGSEKIICFPNNGKTFDSTSQQH